MFLIMTCSNYSYTQPGMSTISGNIKPLALLLITLAIPISLTLKRNNNSIFN